jgi:hypothetical protein
MAELRELQVKAKDKDKARIERLRKLEQQLRADNKALANFEKDEE